MVQKGSGNFEVVEGGAAIVTGRIYVPDDIEQECINMPPIEDKQSDPEMLPLNGRDVYKELRLRGYNYKGFFRGITYANNEGKVLIISIRKLHILNFQIFHLLFFF